MTTIVYDHKRKQVACDSRETANSVIKSDAIEKWFYCGADLYFYAGAVADIDAFKAADKVRGEKIEPMIDGCAIAVKNGKVYKCAYCEHDGYWELELKFSDAMGTGSDWAVAALDFGCDIRAAVDYAISRDSNSGGTVHVFDLETMRFIDNA